MPQMNSTIPQVVPFTTASQGVYTMVCLPILSVIPCYYVQMSSFGNLQFFLMSCSSADVLLLASYGIPCKYIMSVHLNPFVPIMRH